jgi:hypothetical protein
VVLLCGSVVWFCCVVLLCCYLDVQVSVMEIETTG